MISNLPSATPPSPQSPLRLVQHENLARPVAPEMQGRTISETTYSQAPKDSIIRSTPLKNVTRQGHKEKNMAKRIFELAKALGVTSKTILAKCRSEGIEVKNHMSTVKAGLAAVIFEWFSEDSTNRLEAPKSRPKPAPQGIRQSDLDPRFPLMSKAAGELSNERINDSRMRISELADELGITSKMILDKCRAGSIRVKNRTSRIERDQAATIAKWFGKQRIFELAKELGVTSKMVLEKCRAGGIQVKSHMSRINVGQAATITIWFSEKRVFELAKELGVTSKIIILRCRAEGLEVKNHTSRVNVGQAATITHWFSKAPQGIKRSDLGLPPISYDRPGYIEKTQTPKNNKRLPGVKQSAQKKRTNAVEKSAGNRSIEPPAKKSDSGLLDFTSFFGSAKAYEANMQHVLGLRLDQFRGINTELEEGIGYAIRDISEDPLSVLERVERIFDTAINVIWRVEEIQGRIEIPQSWKEVWKKEKERERKTLILPKIEPLDTTNRGSQVRIVRIMTGRQKGFGRVAKVTLQQTSILLDHLLGCRNLKSHSKGEQVRFGSACTMCFVAVELLASLAVDLS